jgi:hypothetical protein
VTSRAVLLVLVLSAATACEAPSLPPFADAAHVDAGHDAGTDTGPPPIGNVWTTTSQIGPFTVAAGQEQTLCLVFDLGNADPVLLRGVRTHLSAGSHHLIVQTADDASGPYPARPCAPFSHGSTTVFIAQSREAALAFPPDAGYPMHAHQLIGLEMHMINYVSADPVDIMGSVELDLSDPDPRVHDVYVLFTGPLGFSLPPHVASTITYDYPLNGVRLLAVTTHMHSLGTYASLHLTPDTTQPGTLLHESHSWSDPPLTTFSPPMVTPAGSWLHLECDYENVRDHTVYWGESFDDEMCFLWAYYTSQ